MLPSYYHEKYTQLRQWELERAAEYARQAASVSRQRNVARQVMSQLAVLFVKLHSWMKKEERFLQQPTDLVIRN